MIDGITLPPSWSWCHLSDLVDYVTSGSRDWSAFYASSGALFIRTQDINTNALDLSGVAHVSLPSNVEGKRTLLRQNDILITITGANVGKCAVVPADIPEAYVSQSVALVRLRTPQLAKFIHAAAQTVFRGRQTELQRMAYGIGRPVLNLNNVRDLVIPIAPVNEQHRIVESIESYVTRLDAAVATLERVQRNLKRYRASVLKAAVEGRLVPTDAELARAEGRDYEPALVLLERILAERRRCWEEAELAKMKAKGKVPKDDGWKARYEEPATADVASLPDLPHGWCWVHFGSVISVRGGYAFKSDDYLEDQTGVPLIRQSELRTSRVNLTAAKYLPADYLDAFGDMFGIQHGDILVGLSGSLSSVSVYQHEQRALQNQRTGLLLASPLVSKDYVLCTYLSVVGEIEKAGKGVAVQNVSPKQIEALLVPLPPIAEQDRIVAEVERHTSLIEYAEQTVSDNLRRCERLRQSILKWAFEGRLVDQDPTDEPASALLERIRAARSFDSTPPTARGRRKARARNS